MLRSSRFTVIDEPFNCVVCGAVIPPLGYTARDHCRECLCSIHVDINPGDRESDCGGVLRPIGAERCKKGVKLIYRCEKCKAVKKNIAAKDDDEVMLLKIFSEPVM